MPLEKTVLKKKQHLCDHLVVPHHERMAYRHFQEIHHARDNRFRHGHGAVAGAVRQPGQERQPVRRPGDYAKLKVDPPEAAWNRGVPGEMVIQAATGNSN